MSAQLPARQGRALHDLLAMPIREYFALVEREPLPPRLSDLLSRVQGAVAASGPPVSFDFWAEVTALLPALRTFAVSLTMDVVRADDLVQETMLRACINQHRFTPGTRLVAWLFTIQRNLFYSDHRKRRREVEDADGAHAAELFSLPHQDDAIELQALCQAIETLPGRQRNALLLVGAQGFTYEQAAERMGCTVGTVKSRVSRARSTLTERFAGSRPSCSST